MIALWLTPPKVETRHSIKFIGQTRTVTQVVEKLKTQVVTKEKIVTKPDGTRSEERTVTEKDVFSHKENTEKEESVKIEQESFIASPLERYQLGLALVYPFTLPTLLGPVIDEVNLGGSVRLGNMPLWLIGGVTMSLKSVEVRSIDLGIEVSF